MSRNKGMQKGTSNYDVKRSDVISSKLKLTYVDSKMYFLQDSPLCFCNMTIVKFHESIIWNSNSTVVQNFSVIYIEYAFLRGVRGGGVGGKYSCEIQPSIFFLSRRILEIHAYLRIYLNLYKTLRVLVVTSQFDWCINWY